MRDLRLGDIIDDYCVKCRRLTNHAIVSLLEGQAAKVRCRTCYGDHDYRHEIAPPTKKELLKQKELFNAVLAGMVPPAALDGDVPASADVAETLPEDEVPAAAAASASATVEGDGTPRKAKAKAVKKKKT